MKQITTISKLTKEQEEMVQQIKEMVEPVEKMPYDMADKFIKLLESAPDAALLSLFQNQVKFCWMVSRRILRDRNYEV